MKNQTDCTAFHQKEQEKWRQLLGSNKSRMSPSSYSPQTYNRGEQSGKLQENGLISEGHLCSSFNKIVRTLLTVVLETSHLLYPEPTGFAHVPMDAHGTVMVRGTYVQLMHLEGGTLLTHSTQILSQPTQERIC